MGECAPQRRSPRRQDALRDRLLSAIARPTSVALHTIQVARADLTLARVVREAWSGASWNKARDLCRSGRVRVNGSVVTDAETRVPLGAEVSFDPEGPKARRGVLSDALFVHIDNEVVVVDKPAGLISVPFEPGDRDTLIDITRAALRRRGPRGFDPELGIVQRLDIDTTGLLVFTRSLRAKRALSQQFRVHSVHRRYLAITHGVPPDGTFSTTLLRDRGDGLRGSFGHFRPARGLPPAEAQHAVTHVRVLEPLRGAALVECRLETGRQHQIRIHLSEAGHPLIGERVYIRDYEGPRIAAPRPMLHARELGFEHPTSGREMRFTREPPADFLDAYRALGGSGRGLHA
jgi:23S rRNA pseudouridine1911/1915/1917 synthase